MNLLKKLVFIISILSLQSIHPSQALADLKKVVKPAAYLAMLGAGFYCLKNIWDGVSEGAFTSVHEMRKREKDLRIVRLYEARGAQEACLGQPLQLTAIQKGDTNDATDEELERQRTRHANLKKKTLISLGGLATLMAVERYKENILRHCASWIK